MGLSGVQINYEKLIEAVFNVPNNPTNVEVWRESFGLFAVVFSEGARFIWIGDFLSDTIIPRGPSDICECAQKESEKPITTPPKTLIGARKCKKIPALAKIVLGLHTYLEEEEDGVFKLPSWLWGCR
ncbi:hypothetical protein Tco_0533772 [Tanacetum coccineum]